MDFNWIRAERKKRGWRMPINDKSLPQCVLSEIETGRSGVTFASLVKIARWFGMGPDELFRRSGASYLPASCATNNLAKVIHTRRITQGLSLRELGRMIGYTHISISKFEKGGLPKKLKVDLIVALDQALGFNGELVGMVWNQTTVGK
jgi:transcriptional regulator with XRE-family HTH domain